MWRDSVLIIIICAHKLHWKEKEKLLLNHIKSHLKQKDISSKIKQTGVQDENATVEKAENDAASPDKC